MRLSLLTCLSCLLFCVCLPVQALCIAYCASRADGIVRGDTNALRHWKSLEQSMTLAGVLFLDMEVNCLPGFSRIVRVETGDTECVDCNLTGGVVGMIPYLNQSERCVQCGGDRTFSELVDPTHDEMTRKCVCPADYELVEQVGKRLLESQMCVPCGPDGCSGCVFPYSLKETGECVCASGYTTLYDASCVPTEVYNGVVVAAAGATTTFQPLNLNNKGILGPSVTSVVVRSYAMDSAVQCMRGMAVGCSLLFNMCVLMMYDVDSLPCKLYLSVRDKRTSYRRLPPLFDGDNTDTYTSDDGVLLATTNITAAGDPMTFLVAVYDWRGNLKGLRHVSEVLNLCCISDADMSSFFKVGSNRRLRCFFDWYKLLQNAGPTYFFELFMRDFTNKSRLVPVPVVMDYTTGNIHPRSLRDGTLRRAMATGYRRRFYLYDTLTDCKLDVPQVTETTPCYVTALRHVVFALEVVDVYRDQHSLKPVVYLQYASGLKKAHNGDLTARTANNILEGGVSVLFIASSSVDKGMMITMIIFCLLCICSAWIRTYGWMRRRQNVMLSIGAVIRFMVYFCNHIGNLFALVVSLASWYIFVLYRAQKPNLSLFLSDNYVFLEAMLYTATAAKGIAVVYKIVEQCNADYFVIDWERSKGQLLRENRILPVSMWRSTFVANELNELQVLRQWRPLLSMTIVLFFLVGLNYLKYTESVPVTSGADEAGTYSLTVMRIALGTFFWVSVSLVLNILEFQIYYRFFCVHPLQSFVDLCSVSNISIMILPETQWGYYIHGESIHAHSDVSMEEFQQNLYLESQGNLPVRGLGGQSKCQTFEVFMGIYMRQYLYMCYAEIEAEYQRSSGKALAPIRPGRQWHLLECVLGFSRKSRVYNTEILAIKTRINSVLKQSVRSAEGTLLMKFIFHRWFDLAPNILYMNGPQSGDKSGKDLFFVDDVLAYGNAFLYGLDVDLFVLYTMLYASMDASMHNVWVALVITFALELFIRWYRMSEGVANISSKTLIDDRFFI
ncbi:hypothetical protein TCDM_06159 [Trypanosoma cruzi Dm28c]|uniref:Transmembrane protein 67 n=2 Tax=Trypanosoma cruzi TaxID=5693 RepID=V5AX80_TRYCR|nr:hypothetical protein TCDM_06159 [Trypanosoma cruzi Dm28c]